MSHSADRMQNKMQKYIDLYRLQQSSIASALHSNFAQPVVAAKNFAAAIKSLNGEDAKLKEAQELAAYILELTDQAYVAAYDMMRQNDTSIPIDLDEPIRPMIEKFGIFLRLNDLGINLNVIENISSISIDRFIKILLLDWIKGVLIYLSRHHDVNNIDIQLKVTDQELKLNIDSNIVVEAEQLKAEFVFITILRQLELLSGHFSIKDDTEQCCMRIVIPYDCALEI